jgi:hypothetical protein
VQENDNRDQEGASVVAQTQIDKDKNKEIVQEGFAEWVNRTGSFFRPAG